jgi:hypothetical protein
MKGVMVENWALAVQEEVKDLLETEMATGLVEVALAPIIAKVEAVVTVVKAEA